MVKTESDLSLVQIDSPGQAWSADAHLVLRDLRTAYGAQLATYLLGENDTETLARWVDDPTEAGPVALDRARAALQIAVVVLTQEAPDTLQVWFQGTEPALGGRAPVEVIRTEQPVDAVAMLLPAAAELLAH